MVAAQDSPPDYASELNAAISGPGGPTKAPGVAEQYILAQFNKCVGNVQAYLTKNGVEDTIGAMNNLKMLPLTTLSAETKPIQYTDPSQNDANSKTAAASITKACNTMMENAKKEYGPK